MKRHAPLVVLLSALVLISLGYSIHLANVKMESPAMEPAIAAGDYLLVWRTAYGLNLPLAGEIVRAGRPARGDIVLIKKEREDGDDRETRAAVLRVVGLPGEVVSITDKEVWIDGERLAEGYVTFTDDRVYPEALSARDNVAAVVVPDDAYFLMGDRRDTTTDSRFFGIVTRDEIKGKVVLVYW
jgi:signal peptidase I